MVAKKQNTSSKLRKQVETDMKGSLGCCGGWGALTEVGKK